MRCLLVVCAMVVVASPLSAKAPVPADTVPPETLKAVQGVLPKGWTAEVKGTTIVVRSEKKVGFYNPIGLPYLPEKPTPTVTEKYEITLQFRPRVTAEAYQKMRKENEEITKKLDEMRNKLRDARISHKFDDWLPQTPDQKKLVADYRAMQKAMPGNRLPDLYTETNSIDLSDSVRFPLGFCDREEAKECEGVKKAIRELFKPHADN